MAQATQDVFQQLVQWGKKDESASRDSSPSIPGENVDAAEDKEWPAIMEDAEKVFNMVGYETPDGCGWEKDTVCQSFH